MENINDVRQFKEKVDLYFDNALSQEEVRNLMHDVKINPNVNRLFKQEQSFRNFIKKNVHRPTVSHNFINSIKKQINIK